MIMMLSVSANNTNENEREDNLNRKFRNCDDIIIIIL